jgi:hypothetical protein
MSSEHKNWQFEQAGVRKLSAKLFRRSLVVIATTSCRDYEVQMIRPYCAVHLQDKVTPTTKGIVPLRVISKEILLRP